MKQPETSSADFIRPFEINGLVGRMARLPAPKGKAPELLIVYGQHSSLERCWELLRYLNRFGAVTAPDLPGFGGMQSFYAIGKTPTIDNLADYLASFIRLRYKRKKVTILGVSFGFVVVTRMLQRYPELTKQVAMVVCLGGAAHYDDYRLSKRLLQLHRVIGWTFSRHVPAFLARRLILNEFVLRNVYPLTRRGQKKFAIANGLAERQRLIDAGVNLWRHNDLRTHAWTLYELMTLNNCSAQIDLPVWYVSPVNDERLDHHLVDQHLRVIFKDAHSLTSNLSARALNAIDSPADAALLIPLRLRRALARP